jgi:hypothetical protein
MQPAGTPPRAGAPRRSAVIGPGHSLATVTDKISAIVLTHETSRGWWLALGLGFLGVGLLGTVSRRTEPA